MKLIPFTFTNEYDNQADLMVNPAYVITLRPDGKTKTQISLASKAVVTVNGSMDEVAKALGQDYDPAPEEGITA